MAILKHIASKSSNYGAALEYLIFKHDELRKKPILDKNGNRIMRDEFYLDGLNCEPYSFDAACQQLNREYQKNKNKDEIKSHHYIISFDPADKDECGLTGERAQAIGLEYAKANFPGHQALVCTHMDGHNGSGNIHVHIVINSLRKLDVSSQPFMERPIDSKAGYKHHLTKDYLKHLQKSLMDICMRENLYQVDLLSPSLAKVSEQEYYAKRRGQINLDLTNLELAFINEEVYNGLTLDDERIRQAIIEFRPRLVVIDPIQAYLGSDSDLQIAGRARKLMRRLGMWAAGYDCAIVLIGHLNKKEGSKGLYRSLGSIDVVAAARSVLQVERDTENPDIRIVHQIKNSLAPTAEDIRFSISADKGFRWLECRPQFFGKQQLDTEPKFDTEQQKAVYWIKHFLEKGDMSANEIYCRLDNEGVSKRVARMVKTEMGTLRQYQRLESGERNILTCSFGLACRVIEALDMDVSKFYHGDYCLEEEVKTMRDKGIASRKKSSI